MNTVVKKRLILIAVTIVLVFGGQGISHAQTLSASTTRPLREAKLNESAVTLRLIGGTYEQRLREEHADAFKVSGIAGVTLKSTFDSFNPFHDVDRVSNTAVRVELNFEGNMSTDGTLTFTVGADAIANYNGPALTVWVPVREGDPFSIRGPWLWMVVPTDPIAGNGVSADIDSLADASGDTITEAHVAQNGVNEGDTIGYRQWSLSDIGSGRRCRKYNLTLCVDPTVCWDDNINNVVGALGLGTGYNTKAYTAYALINLIAPREHERILDVKSGDAIKVWLNGNLVHRAAAKNLGCRKIDVPLACDPRVCISDPARQESDVSAIPVTLKAGSNLLLVKVRQHGEYWNMNAEFFGDFTTAAPKAKTTVDLPPTSTPEIPVTTTTLNISPSPVQSPAIGEQFTLSLNIAGGENVAGYQATVLFDITALRYVSSANGDYLPAGAFFVPPVVEGNRVELAGTSLSGESSGAGTLATLTFEVIAVKASTLTLSDALLANSAGVSTHPQVEAGQITAETPQLSGDANGDGTVNIQDLVLVASNIGQTGQNAADVNGDGVVNIADLVLVAGALGTTAAAPSLLPQTLAMLTAADVEDWLTQARQMALTDPAYLRGIAVLEQLLVALAPKETALLPNYPNPFNPETWIPYRLAEDAFVTLTIYDVSGQVVRTLDVGHRVAAFYESRSKAIYWDGRNDVGEGVASGVYFYHLSAGDYSATRRMLILK